MKKLVFVLALTILNFGYAQSVFAEIKPNTAEIAVYGGMLFGDSVGSATVSGVTFNFGDMDNAFGGGASIGYNFTENIALELAGDYWPGTDFDGTATDGVSTIDITSSTDQFHLFAKKIALAIDRALGSYRCIRVMEGFDIKDHAHLKLFPVYEGKNYDCSYEGTEKASEEELRSVAEKIRKVV